MKYTVILEEGQSSYGAFVPDLPGCIAAGETKEAIEFHIEGLIENGVEIPKPHCDFAHVEVSAA